MSNSTDINNNKQILEITTEILVRGIVGLTLAIFITCGTSINKNSKFEIILMKTSIVKTILTLGLTVSAILIKEYVAIAIIFLISFAFYWMLHGVKVYQNDITDTDKRIINDLNIKGNVLFNSDTSENDDNNENDIEEANEDDNDEEKRPLLNNLKNKGKELIINGINDAMSIISNNSTLSNISKGINNINNMINTQNQNQPINRKRANSQSPNSSSNKSIKKNKRKSLNSQISNNLNLSPPEIRKTYNKNSRLTPSPKSIRDLNNNLSISTDNLIHIRRNSSSKSYKSDDELNDINYDNIRKTNI